MPIMLESYEDEESRLKRLSRITTAWTLVVQAHNVENDNLRRAQCSLLERYIGAAHRYLLGATKDADLADELFQDFAIRFLRGGFRRADPARGRFRDFVKVALINLVNQHHSCENRRTKKVVGGVLEPAKHPHTEHELRFVKSWREELIAKAWDELATVQEAREVPYHTLLRKHAEEPDLRSSQLAEWLTERCQSGKPYTDVGVRKLVQRGRRMLSDFVLDEVAYSLGGGTLDEVEEELIEIGLHRYCRAALYRRRGQRGLFKPDARARRTC